MEQTLYRISSKRMPSIWDQGTVYKQVGECSKCKAIPSIIMSMGAYLPSYAKPFGIAVAAYNGLVVSDEGFKYLKDNGIVEFEVGDLNIKFAKRKIVDEKYHWIRPRYEVELDSRKGPSVCNQCGCGRWSEEDWETHKINGKISYDIFRIKYTWVDFVTEHFIKVAKKIPGGCYIDFEPWDYH